MMSLCLSSIAHNSAACRYVYCFVEMHFTFTAQFLFSTSKGVFMRQYTLLALLVLLLASSSSFPSLLTPGYSICSTVCIYCFPSISVYICPYLSCCFYYLVFSFVYCPSFPSSLSFHTVIYLTTRLSLFSPYNHGYVVRNCQ